MLKIICERKRICKLQEDFINIMSNKLNERIIATIGFQGGNRQEEILWSDKLQLWMTPGVQWKGTNRFWNAFGIDKPVSEKSMSITCEINMPYKLNRRIGGIFAEDEYGNVFILHRGNIGGSKKGISKKLFRNKYTGEWVEACDYDRYNNFALIGELYSNDLPYQIQNFVYEIKNIKGLKNSLITSNLETEGFFSPEFAGNKFYSTKGEIKAKCNHGLVVNNLAREIEKLGLKVGNDRNRDLFILNNDNQISSIFEIKTGIARTNIYSAIGQLLVYSSDINNKTRLYLVIPYKINPKFVQLVNKIGIKVIYYILKDGKVLFENLIDEISK